MYLDIGGLLRSKLSHKEKVLYIIARTSAGN